MKKVSLLLILLFFPFQLFAMDFLWKRKSYELITGDEEAASIPQIDALLKLAGLTEREQKNSLSMPHASLFLH